MKKSLAVMIGSAAMVGGTLVGATTLGVAGAGETTEDPAAVQTDFVQIQDDAETPDGDETGEGCEGRHGRRGGRDLGTVAEALGISVEDLRAARADGQTIREIAEANGVDPQTVDDAVVANAEERLAEKVEAGDLTQAEADEKLAEVAERAEEKLDRVPGERGQDGAADEDASA